MRILGTTNEYAARVGHINDLARNVGSGAVIHLDPNTAWTFGPPGKNMIDLRSTPLNGAVVDVKRLTIIGHGATVAIDLQSIMAGVDLTLEDLTLACRGDPELRPGAQATGFVAIERADGARSGGSLTCRNVNITTETAINALTNIKYLVQLDTKDGAEGEDIKLSVVNGSFLHLYHSAEPANASSSRMLGIASGSLSVSGTLELGRSTDQATTEPSFQINEGISPQILSKTGKIVVNAGMLVSGEFDLPLVIDQLHINTQSYMTPAIAIRMGDVIAENPPETRNLRLRINHLTLARSPGAAANTQVAIKPVATVDNNLFETLADANTVDDIVGEDGYSMPRNNTIFIGRHTQVGFGPDLAQSANLYPALVAATTPGIVTDTEINVRI